MRWKQFGPRPDDGGCFVPGYEWRRAASFRLIFIHL